jgi:polygalacturonase
MRRSHLSAGKFPPWLRLLTLFALKPCFRTQEIVEVQCPVKDYGAVGDGTTYDTAAIQQAIDACGQSANGGMVMFDTGKSYLIASVTIPSGVRLNLPAGASLIAGTQVRVLPRVCPGPFI